MEIVAFLSCLAMARELPGDGQSRSDHTLMSKLFGVLAVALASLTAVQAVPATPKNNLTLIAPSVWGNPSNPNNIQLRVYEPKQLKSRPAIILAVRCSLCHLPDCRH